MLRITAVFLLLASACRAQVPCSQPVSYTITNDCLWNAQTHPVDYPSSAHFSPLCGVVHNMDYSMWQLNTTASTAVKYIAETGSCRTFSSEVSACETAGNCAPDAFFSFGCEITGATAGVCKHSGVITVSSAYRKVSLLSMLAPSPDWIVGLDSVDLCQADSVSGVEYWVDTYPPVGYIPLDAMDAGTDSGTTFTSLNLPTDPFEPITLFDAEDTSNIFYNPEEMTLNPICQIKLERNS